MFGFAVRVLIPTVLLAWLQAGLVPVALLAAPAPSPLQQLDDPIEQFTPKVDRNEEDEDRLTAAALFSAGRTLEQRDKQHEALRRYLRALRYAPDARPILREMIPLAFTLQMRDVAMRHLTAHLDDLELNDPLLLRAVAEYLAESNDFQGALGIYRKVDEMVAGGRPSRAQVLVKMELGRLNFLVGNYVDAAAAYEFVFDALASPNKYGIDAKMQRALAGEEGELFELMGSVFLEAKQTEAARRAFERLSKRKNDPAKEMLNAARLELAAGNSRAALDELQKYFQESKKSEFGAPYEVLIAALKDQDKADEIIPRLEELLKARPEDAVLAFYLGDEYRKAERWDAAAKALKTAIEAQPSTDAFLSLFQVYQKTGDAAEMLELLGTVVEKAGTLALLDEEVKAIVEDQKLLGEILSAAKELAQDSKPEQASKLQAATLLASQAKAWDDVEPLLNAAIKANPKSARGLLMACGLDLLVGEKFDRAAALFQRGIDEMALPEDNPAFEFYLAGALAMQEKTDEALVAARRAAEKKPDDPMFASRPAWILYHGKRYEEAEKEYQKFLKKFDDDFTTPGAREAVQQAKMVLSNLYVLQNDIPKAVEYLEQVLDEFPDDAGANNDLGYLWADENRHLKRALRMVQFAVAEDPENAAYRDSLGWALFRLGRHAEAFSELQRAIDLEKAEGKELDGTVLDHLGDVYAKLGRSAEAKAAWKQSIEAYRRENETEKIKSVQKKLDAPFPFEASK